MAELVIIIISRRISSYPEGKLRLQIFSMWSRMRSYRPDDRNRYQNQNKSWCGSQKVSFEIQTRLKLGFSQKSFHQIVYPVSKEAFSRDKAGVNLVYMNFENQANLQIKF